MSLAWSTVALLVLLLPGFLFFIGLYLPERISRDIVPGSTLTQLGGIVFIAFLIHATLYVLLSTCNFLWVPGINLDLVFKAFNSENFSKVSQQQLSQNIEEFRWWILIYFISTSSIGFIFGFSTGKLIVRGTLRFLAKHNWIYDLIEVNKDAYTLAFVLTNIRADDRILIYRGFLKEFCFTKEGKISYLVLTNCSRYYLKLGKKKPETSAQRDWLVIGMTTEDQDNGIIFEKQWSYMVIEGEDIANVVFDRYIMLLSKKGIEQLFEEINSEQTKNGTLAAK